MATANTKADGSRTYEVNGKSLPSVTTILGALAKPALVPWAAKMTAEAAKDILWANGISNLADGLITIQLEDGDGRKGLDTCLAEAKKAHRAKKKDAAAVGTRVHEAIQAWIESDGKMDPGELKDEQARKGLEAFIAWGEEHDVHIVAWEEVVHDGEYYAGRFDLLADIDGNITLLDFKTSSAIWPEYWLQVNAYALCLQRYHCPPSHVAILRIDPDTGAIEYQSKEISERLQNAFKCLSLYYHFAVTMKGDK